MVEYILCVQTDLQALGLRDLERLRHACVSAPLPRSFHHPLAQGTPLSGKRILKKNLAGLGIRDRVKGTGVPEVLQGRHIGALRIRDRFEVRRRKVAPGAGADALELDLPAFGVERSDNIRRSVVIQHILGGNAERLSSVQIHDPAHLPTLDDSRQDAGTVTEQEPIRSEWQRERSVGPEVMHASVG